MRITRPLKTTRQIGLLAGSALLCGGCMLVGPDYRTPATTLPDKWSTGPGPHTTTAAMTPELSSHWWTALNDPLLSAFMEQARTNNLDVRQAEARLRQARAQRGAAQAGLFPTLEANASAARNRSREINGERATTDLFLNGLDAAWELDVFGKNRRALEAANATLQASQEEVNAVRVSLFAEVALNYVDIRALQLRISLAETNLASLAETCDITHWRYEAGLTTQLDLERARVSLERTRAALPLLQTSLAQACHRLAVLLGEPPGALKDTLAPVRAIPIPPDTIAVGIPAEVLRQRPDVRRAERKLAAQTAQIGVAKAAQYPDFNLIGSIGLESLTLENLYASGADTAQAAVKAGWTLLDFGRTRRNIEVQTALQAEVLGQYEAAVLAALEDVENALVAFANEQDRRDALKKAMAAGQNAFVLARHQYTSGLVDFQAVLDTQQALLAVQDQLAASEGAVTADLVRLYKALGGGWTPLPATTAQNTIGDNP